MNFLPAYPYTDSTNRLVAHAEPSLKFAGRDMIAGILDCANIFLCQLRFGTTTRVDMTGYRLQVVRIAASTLSAKVVHIQAVRDGTAMSLKVMPMGENLLSVVNHDPVAIPSLAALPYPARRKVPAIFTDIVDGGHSPIKGMALMRTIFRDAYPVRLRVKRLAASLADAIGCTITVLHGVTPTQSSCGAVPAGVGSTASAFACPNYTPFHNQFDGKEAC